MRCSRHSPSTSSGSSTAHAETVPKEKECMLCHRAQADTNICGDKRVKFKLCVHTYCQILASGLYPKEDTGLFLAGDTRRIIREAAKKSCFICYKMGASITCCQTGCTRAFHLPCAPDGECVTQYFGAYRSFCWEHRPQQALQPRPSQDNTCSICLDDVEDKISYKTMGCPACQDARFHRHCIQRLALHAGIGFRCPCCLNQESFMMEMLIMGIRLFKRPPSWESDQEARPSDQRHGHCDATMCLCPGDREHTEADGPWQLWLCSSCAAKGTHRHCSSLGNSTDSCESNTCAGTDSATTDKPELVSPRTSKHPVSTPPQGTSLLKNSCSISPQRALKRHYPEEEIPSQTTYSPPAKRRRIENGPGHSAEVSKPSTSRQELSGLSQGTLAAKRQAARLRPPYRPPWIFHGSTTDNRSQAGPIRMRHIRRQQRRAKKPYSQPREQHQGKLSASPQPSSPLSIKGRQIEKFK